MTTIAKVFQGIFTTNGNSNFQLVDEVLQPVLSETMNDTLIAIPSLVEIKEAVFDINSSKAPGPDGFSSKFYQAYWPTIGHDVSREIRSFFASSRLNSRHNETHVRLIPKGLAPRKVGDYRPIALCNVHYKIIAKILTKRLQPILHSLISPFQSAFVPNRVISDNVLITHEVLHFLRTSEAKKYCSMAVKTDMSKAYDRIEWGFLQAVLKRLGFHDKWISWVMECVQTVSYKFLINGTPKGQVIPSRGLRQGDPLSPYLFILCTEVLSRLCIKAQRHGNLPGIKVARASPPINHLLFADDTMFFCKSSPTCCASLGKILEQYEAISGQCINLAKSSITFSSKTSGDTKTKVKQALKISQDGGIGKYLGLPEHFGRKKRDTSRFLSGAGKQILLKSILMAMPSCAMSCFKLPSSLCKQIQSVLLRFWWYEKPGKRKMSWVAWSKLTLPKFEGGLGFRDIEAFNDVFLAKIGWRLFSNPESLLAKTLHGKYCHTKTFLECPSPSSASHGWRGILIGRDLLKKGLGWSIGDGSKVRIWADPWLSLQTPQRPFGPPPEPTSDMVVKDLMLPSSKEWNPRAIRSLLPQYEDAIRAINLSKFNLPDSLIWLPEKSGVYTTKTGYHIAINSGLTKESSQSPFKWNSSIWRPKVAPKIKNFLWKAASGALSLGSNLAKRGLMSSICCKRCGDREDELHLFLHCPFTQSVWAAAPLHNHFLSGRFQNVQDLLTKSLAATSLPPIGLSGSPLTPWILWNLWKARNTLLFEDRSFTEKEIMLKSIKEAKEWQAAQLALPQQITTRHLALPSQQEGPSLNCFVDVAWSATTRVSGHGWFFQDSQGRTQRRFTEAHCFVASALTAEALTVRSALLAIQADPVFSTTRRIAIHSDSQVLVTLLNSKASSNELKAIIFDISCVCAELCSVSFHFVPRLNNMLADSLAKSAFIAANSFSPSGV